MLLLDEPFGALDAFTREELWCVLRDLWTRRRCTVILVTHELREAVFLADTVYVMSPRPGRIIARARSTLPRPRTLETTFEPGFRGPRSPMPPSHQPGKHGVRRATIEAWRRGSPCWCCSAPGGLRRLFHIDSFVLPTPVESSPRCTNIANRC